MSRAHTLAALTAPLAFSACGPGPSPDERLLQAGLAYLRQPDLLAADAVIEQAFLSRWTENGRARNALCGSYRAGGRRLTFVRPSVEDDDYPVGLQNAYSPQLPVDWNRWCRGPVRDAAGRPVEYRQAAQ